jgi:hypothetical protein
MTDGWGAERRELKGAAPTITAYTGATYPGQKGSAMPPDSNGAVSGKYIVEFLNGVFSVYDKQGALIGSHTEDKVFWLYAGIPPGVFSVVDPRTVFLPDAGRYGQWLAVQLDMGFRVLMATTDPNDPTQDPGLRKWKAAAFDLPGNDFTMLGYDARWIYIGLDVAEGAGRVPEIAVIPRSKALAWPPQLGPGDVRIIRGLTPQEYGTNLYPVIAPRGDGTAALAIGLDTVTNSHLTYSLISNGAMVYHDRIEVPPFEPIPKGHKEYRVRQPSVPDDQQSLVAFLNSNVVAAPVGDGSNVWVAHTISSSSNPEAPGTHLGVRWYRLAIDSLMGRPSLAKWGVIGYQDYDFFNPSILSFGQDDYTLISVSRSGNAHTPRDPRSRDCGNIGAYVALVRETPTDYWYEVFALRSGQADNYIPDVVQRWGDYSTICRDPTNPRAAWVFNQYVAQGGRSTSLNTNVIARIDVPLPQAE